ncbi:MAG: peptidoglycan bridge formation glycyltransferase FemA/FemB family protein [Pseudomonadota bacterium]
MITSNFTAAAPNFFATDEMPAKLVAVPSDNLSLDLKLEYVSARQWDEVAAEFADLIPEQMGSFNSGHWGEDNVEFVTFRKNAELVGGAVLIVRKIPFSGTGVAMLKWGPIFQKPGTSFDAVMYRATISCLKAEYCKKRKLHLTVVPVAKPETSEHCTKLLPEMDFEKGDGFPAPERYIVNVQDSSEALMTSLDQKWRYNLRKALKNDFSIRVVDPLKGLDEFLDLYSQMIDRKQFHDSSAINALEKIVKESPEETRPIIVLVSHDSRVTAGGVFHVAGNMATYMFGATDTRALKLKAGYALHWWVAEYLCEQQGIDWYDLGGNDLDGGLHQFKKGFVGKSGHILNSPHRYHFAQSISAKLAGFMAFRVRDLIASASRKLHSIKNKR